MNEGTGELGQVLSVEVEGIKMALNLSKGALKIAARLCMFLFHLLKDGKYRKEMGKTNIKNLKSRSGGGELVPLTMTEDSYQLFQKYAKSRGILFHGAKPLPSAKGNGNRQVLICSCDVPATQDLLAQIKEDIVKRSVKKGMSKEEAERDFDANNRFETMEEFAENVGVMTPQETFDRDMKERFGNDYGSIFIKENKTGRIEEKKLNELAAGLKAQARMAQYRNKPIVGLQFQYDEKKKVSQVIEATDTHIKIYRKWENKDGSGKEAWVCLWIPRNAIVPSQREAAGKEGMWTAMLKKDDVIVVVDPTGNQQACRMPAEEVARRIGMAPDMTVDKNQALELPDPDKKKSETEGMNHSGSKRIASGGRKK